MQIRSFRLESGRALPHSKTWPYLFPAIDKSQAIFHVRRTFFERGGRLGGFPVAIEHLPQIDSGDFGLSGRRTGEQGGQGEGREDGL